MKTLLSPGNLKGSQISAHSQQKAQKLSNASNFVLK